MADGEWDWLDAIGNLGFDAGDLSSLVLDTETGQLVDIASLSPQDLADLDMSGSPSGVDPNDPSATGAVPNVSGGPTGTSLSDQLRSRAADSSTDGTQPYDWTQMADPSASIASAGSSDWAKAIAKGLGSALGGLGSGLKGLGGLSAPAPGGSLPGLSGMGTASTPGAPGLPDAGSVGGLASLGRPGMQDAIGAALMQGQARTSPFAMQAPIDPGPAPRPFTPLALPTAGGGVPMAAQAPVQRLSGLQRLLSERLG